ncbi:hypothetical protein Emag_002170 [Eimeria magna]
MTAFGSLRFINVGSCMSDETAQRLGLKTSLKKARYVDEESKLAWTILSISVVNDGCFFVEALFVAVLNKPRETCSVLHNLRKLMPSICSKRREQHGKAQQQPHQQQAAAATPRLSLVDKEQEEEEAAVSQRQLLQLRAQQAFELSCSRQKSQQPSESTQQLDIKASSMSPSWRASYPLGSTQATESEAWHTLQAE